MRRKIVFIGYRNLTSIVNKVIKSLDTEIQIDNIEVELGQADNMARQLDTDEEVAVIVTVRGHANFIPKLQQTSLIVIDVTADDLLSGLRESARYTDKIVLMSYSNIFSKYKPYQEILNLEIIHDYYYSVEEAREKIRYWQSQGINTFVGTSIVYNEAKISGARAIYLYSVNSITESFLQAIDIVKAIQRDSIRLERMNTIIQEYNYALISSDRGGKIQVCNQMAGKLLKLHNSDLLNLYVQQIFPEIDFREIIHKKQAVENIIVRNNSEPLVLNILPIVVHKNFEGLVISFQESIKVQDAGNKIRKRLAAKGFVAKYYFSDIIHKSKVMEQSIEKARIYANTDASILIYGETGVGKELFAQSIHNASPRKNKPFVAINCSALPEDLLESELFGYEEGAFTGAKKNGKLGLFELAHEGTLFLDEIGEITQKLQSRLLRVIQEKEIMRLGGNSVIPVDVRIITATNKDLKYLVDQSEFRADLYYRLNTLFLQIPSLRERKEDIPLLVENFLFENNLNPLDIENITKKWNNLLKSLPWKGNVRELENLIKRISIIYKIKKDEYIIEEIIQEWIHKQGYQTVEYYEEKNNGRPRKLAVELDNNEWEHIQKVLEQTAGNKTKAAEILGISRSTLWRKLKSRDFLNGG